MRIGSYGGANVSGDGEKRTGKRLGGSVAGKEGWLCEPAALHDRGVQQRQHHMTAPKDQRSRTVEAGEDGRKETAARRQQDGGREQHNKDRACPWPRAWWGGELTQRS